ncbi:MAG: type II secretion system F family protein [archaeon]
MARGLFYSTGEMIIPYNHREKLRQYLMKTGNSGEHYELYGKLFFLSFPIACAIVFFLFKYIALIAVFLSPIFFIGALILQMLLVWMYYEILLFQRTEKIEKVLPDFLEAVAVNLRAGMSFDKALYGAVEPEYDVLSKEIDMVAKKVMTGKDTEEALLEFSSKYNSPILRESIDLMIVGIRSGGEISELIDRVVENVKQAAYLKKELLANVMSYVIFITMISLFIAPTLYALSYNLMIIIQDLGGKLTSSGGESLVKGLGSFGSVTINKNDFISYSHWCIIIISVTTSLIIADLREGSIKGSIKYVFAFIAISYLVYEVMLFVFTGIFGNLVH